MKIVHLSPEEEIYIIKKNVYNIKKIKNPSLKAQLFIVNGLNYNKFLELVENPHEDAICQLLRREPKFIDKVKVTKKMIEVIIDKNPFQFAHMVLSREIQEFIADKNPSFFRIVINPEYDLIKSIIEKNPLLLNVIKPCDKELQLIAIKQTKEVALNCHPDIIEEYLSYDEQLELLRSNESFYHKIKNPNDEMNLIAIIEHKIPMGLINNASKNIIKMAVENGVKLRDIKGKDELIDEEIKKIAIEKNISNVEYLYKEEITFEIQKYVVKKLKSQRKKLTLPLLIKLGFIEDDDIRKELLSIIKTTFFDAIDKGFHGQIFDNLFTENELTELEIYFIRKGRLCDWIFIKQKPYRKEAFLKAMCNGNKKIKTVVMAQIDEETLTNVIESNPSCIKNIHFSSLIKVFKSNSHDIWYKIIKINPKTIQFYNHSDNVFLEWFVDNYPKYIYLINRNISFTISKNIRGKIIRTDPSLFVRFGENTTLETQIYALKKLPWLYNKITLMNPLFPFYYREYLISESKSELAVLINISKKNKNIFIPPELLYEIYKFLVNSAYLTTAITS